MAEKARRLFDSITGAVTRPGFGDVDINSRSVKDDLSHGVGAAKAAVIPAIPEIIRQGKQIDFQQNWKGRAYDGYVFAAPVTMDGHTAYAAAVVKRSGKNRFYLHEVIDTDGNAIKIDAGESANQTSLAANGDAGTHSPASMDLTPAEASLVGPAPTASSETSGPAEGTRPPSVDSTIPQRAEAVNFRKGLRPGIQGDRIRTTDGQEEAYGPEVQTDAGDFLWKNRRAEAADAGRIQTIPAAAGGIGSQTHDRGADQGTHPGWARGRVIEGELDNGPEIERNAGDLLRAQNQGSEAVDAGVRGEGGQTNGGIQEEPGQRAGVPRWARGRLIEEERTMGKMNMTFEEFMEKMYGGGKPEKLSREDLDRLKEEMREVTRRMKAEGVQPPPPGHEDV